MFILYAIPLGILLGFLVGGRLEHLADLRFRWGWLAIAGLVVQVGLFSGAVDTFIGRDVGALIYVASTGAVLLAVVQNVQLPGMLLVAVGATANLAAIVANGGIMPTTAAALAQAGLPLETALSNSAVREHPVLAPLTDIFALPAWVPMANVFSIGDVVLGIGVVVLLAQGMRGRRTASSPEA